MEGGLVVAYLVLFEYLSECLYLCANEALQVSDVIAAFDNLLLVPGELPLPLGIEALRRARAFQDQTVDKAGEMGQAPRDLVGLAGDKEIDSIVLASELVVELVLEPAQGDVGVARDCDGIGLALGGVQLDLLFEGVVIDVIQAPSWHRFTLEIIAVFHVLCITHPCPTLKVEICLRAAPRQMLLNG